MRKLLLSVLLLSIVCLPVFSDYEEKERFNFTAYYQKQHDEKYVTLDVYDSRLNSGIIMISSQEQPNGEKVFSWEISGNISSRVYLAFSFTPLQAYLNGTYYIPAHKFQLVKDTDTIITPTKINNNPLSDNFVVKSKNHIKFEESSANYPYPAVYTGEVTSYAPKANSNDPYYTIPLYGSIQIKKNGKLYDLDEANGEEATWTRKGYCTLTVYSYDDTDGDFNYISNVKVEVYIQ